jgi:hypothetical protein
MSGEKDDIPPHAISVDFVAGQLSAIRDLVAAHAKNSDRRFDEVKDELEGQNRQHASDKAEAKRENENRHSQNQSLWTATHALASKTDAWVTDRGDPMWKAWSEAEKKKSDQKLVNKGRAITIAKISSLVGLVVGGIAWLGHDKIGPWLKKIGEALS